MKNYSQDQNGEASLFMIDSRFSENDVKCVLKIVKEFQIAPLVVGQRVLALHPKYQELRTATLLTSDVSAYHAQFDKPDL